MRTRSTPKCLGHDFGAGERLNGLAKAHFIANEATAGAGGKQGAFRLVFVQRDFHECFEGRAFMAARKSLGESLGAKGGVADFGEVLANVVAAADFMLGGGGVGQELLKRVDRIGQKQSFIVEVLADFAHERHWDVAAGPKANLALAAVMEEKFAIGRLEVLFERAFAMAATELGEREFEVLARSQRIGGEIAAGTEIVAEAGAANDEMIRRLARRVDDLKL